MTGPSSSRRALVVTLSALLLLWLWAVGSAGARPYQLGPLVRVSGGSPFKNNCNGSGSQATGAEGEPSLAVDPANPRRILIAWKQDVQATESTADGAALSTDGGRSWNRKLLRGDGACNGGEAKFTHVSDPWAAFGANHVAWISTLPFTDGNPGAVAVHHSTNGGRSFSRAVFVDRDVHSYDFDDKEALAADPGNPRRAYITWVKEKVTPPPVSAPIGSTIFIARTQDGGATWSRKKIASTGTGVALAGGIVKVEPNGDVVLTYPKVTPDHASACVSDQECAGDVTVFAVRSQDHGATWSAPVVAARYRRGPVHDPEGDKIKASAEVYSLSLDPHGVAYLVAHDQSDPERSRLIVARSTNHGRSWRRLRDADSGSPVKGLKLQPIVAASGNALGILYFDFRDDHNHGDGHAQYSWWFLYSRNGGSTWKEERVSKPSDFRAAASTPVGHFIGDYFGLQAAGSDFIAAIVLARPLAQKGPTDVYFRRLASP